MVMTYAGCEAYRLSTAQSLLDYYNILPTELAKKTGIPAYKLLLWRAGTGSISYDELKRLIIVCKWGGLVKRRRY